MDAAAVFPVVEACSAAAAAVMVAAVAAACPFDSVRRNVEWELVLFGWSGDLLSKRFIYIHT